MWYPLKLSYHIRRYYHGRRLIAEQLGKPDLPSGDVAETWEISDFEDTSGVIENGAFAGQSLRELTRDYPDELVASGWRGPHFPILEKFIDGTDRLPVHVHPDDEVAGNKYNAPNGKTEAWRILSAPPEAGVLVGVKPGLSAAELTEAFKAQDYDAVMHRIGVAPGDTVYVPAGGLHAFGPDTLVFEVEQTSDLGQITTPFDLYGNTLSEADRDNGIRQALDDMDAGIQPRPHSGLVVEDGLNHRRVLCAAGPYFAMEHWTLHESCERAGEPRRFATLTNLGEALDLEHDDGSERLERAQSCILPAALGKTRLDPQGVAELLVCYVPDLGADIIQPARAVGYDDADIRGLGELGL